MDKKDLVKKILMDLLEVKYFSNVTEAQQNFVDNIKASEYFENLKIERNNEGAPVLKWQSRLDLVHIACRFHDNEILFSKAEIYKWQCLTMKGIITKHYAKETNEYKTIQAEIEEIKRLFKEYMPEVEECFK